MIKVTITINRTASVPERQSQLDEMATQLKAQTAAQGQPTRLVVEGVNPYENQFPEWLQVELEKNGFEFDDINLYYHRSFDKMGDAKKFVAFFNDEFKAFFAQNPEKYYFLESVAVQVLDDHPASKEYPTF